MKKIKKYSYNKSKKGCFILLQDTYNERKKSKVKSKGTTISENSDCGYVTQIENQESISTSSNEDEVPAKKHFHPKQQNHKQRSNNKKRPGATLQERKRKKIVKRGKANM